jgi:hypothetical protein
VSRPWGINSEKSDECPRLVDAGSTLAQSMVNGRRPTAGWRPGPLRIQFLPLGAVGLLANSKTQQPHIYLNATLYESMDLATVGNAGAEAARQHRQNCWPRIECRGLDPAIHGVSVTAFTTRGCVERDRGRAGA